MVSVFAPFPHLILGEANRIDRVNTHRPQRFLEIIVRQHGKMASLLVIIGNLELMFDG